MIQKIITFDDVIKYDPNCLQIPDHPYRILIIRGSGSGKTNSSFNLISQQHDSDKIYLYAQDPYEAKYQFLISKRTSSGLKHFNDLNLLLNTKMIWMVFIKTLKNTTQIKKKKNITLNVLIFARVKFCAY